MGKQLIAPSILSADFSNLKSDIEMVNESQADWFHIDIMDGVFVPNISFGMPVLKSIKEYANKPLDVHLMITNPKKYVKKFAELGSDILTVHHEACGDNMLELIKDIEVLALEDFAVISSINRLKDDLISNTAEVKHFSRVASLERFEEKNLEVENQIPTHLLWRNKAFPIGQRFDVALDPATGPYKSEEPVGRIERLDSDLFIEPLKEGIWELNGKSLTKRELLFIGDRLKLHDEPFILISEIKDG